MKIFIADHSEVFRLGLTRLLEKRYGEAHILGGERIKMLPDPPDWTETDLVILQESRDEKKENDFISSLNALKNRPKILVLSDQNDFAQARHLFFHGINGYADRAASPDIIIEAVQMVLSGNPYLETSLLIQCFKLLTATNRSTKISSDTQLTSRELVIATYLVEGLKISEISKLLNRRAATISKQKSNIYQKLGISNVFQLMHCMGVPKNQF